MFQVYLGFENYFRNKFSKIEFIDFLFSALFLQRKFICTRKKIAMQFRERQDPQERDDSTSSLTLFSYYFRCERKAPEIPSNIAGRAVSVLNVVETIL